MATPQLPIGPDIFMTSFVFTIPLRAMVRACRGLVIWVYPLPFLLWRISYYLEHTTFALRSGSLGLITISWKSGPDLIPITSLISSNHLPLSPQFNAVLAVRVSFDPSIKLQQPAFPVTWYGTLNFAFGSKSHAALSWKRRRSRACRSGYTLVVKPLAKWTLTNVGPGSS